ncbi:helix-turn-helix transcriptional regulator [Arthrobacter sp. ERGS1:01]|uniref:helix-turn-helix transcriptional regulator n=1 Tax=Arthrobacter sp. ERGS1:01 TaxID=1704044 RepID=UPI000A6A3063|nr:helix-turn-helix transcriptional regulator [Arthrobacter sp. ERGS1:01]
MDESRADMPVALFAANLKRFREVYGWSQSELARRMQESGWPKYSQVAVSRTEEGSRSVRLDEAVALAKLFDRKLQDLLDPEDVLDSWLKLRFFIDDYSNAVSTLRLAVDDVEERRIFVSVNAQLLREEIELAGGSGKVSETMNKTLSNAEIILTRSTLDLVEGELEALERETFEAEVDGHGVDQEAP